jgi:hypothetical protein
MSWEGNGDLLKDCEMLEGSPVITRFHEQPSGHLKITSSLIWPLPSWQMIAAQLQIRASCPLDRVTRSIDRNGIASCSLVEMMDIGKKDFCFQMDELCVETVNRLRELVP